MIKEEKHNKLKYIISYPDDYIQGNKYPILFFMHGAGTRGDELELLYDNPFFQITDKMNLPFITIAPQCNADTWFDVFEQIISLVKHIYDEPYTDKSKFYAMGASMGGYAVWQMAMSCPDNFAAIVPICGGGMYWNAGRLKNIPIWAFHGDSDPVVSTYESIKMVNAVNNCGGDAKLTIYDNCGHDAWSETYKNIMVYEWLLSKEKIDSNINSNEFNNSNIYG